MKIRTNPFLYIFGKPGEKSLTIFEPYQKRYFQLEQVLLLDLLNFTRSWKSEQIVYKFIGKLKSATKNYSPNLTIDSLIEQNILIDDNHPMNEIIASSKNWFKYDWNSSFYYHLTSRDYKFLDYSREEDVIYDRELMKKYAKLSPPPPVYKQNKNSKFYKLTEPLKGRLQRLKFSPSKGDGKDFNKQTLSELLYLVFGEIGSINFPIFGKSLLKTSPSGGARHPSEAYLFLLKDLGFPKGVYHYSVKDHGLELVEERDFADILNDVFFQLNYFPNFNPAAVIVISSLFERSMWRYREPRSFRVILFDIGHLIATLKVVAQALGLEIFVGHGFDDKKVKELLGFRTAYERPFYFVAIGHFENENNNKQ